jgi:hypothetical protein
MIQTLEAMTDDQGILRLLDPVQLPGHRRVLITVLDEEPSDEIADLARLSEPALAADWDQPEEDAAWLHLAQLPSL